MPVSTFFRRNSELARAFEHINKSYETHLDLAASEGTQDCWLVVPAIIAEVKLDYAKKPNDTNR